MERRIGVDLRSVEEKFRQGERRVTPDRRAGADRRKPAETKRRLLSLPNVLIAAAALCFVDIHYFDGEHSSQVVVGAANDIHNLTTEWIGDAFPR
jgi:hypothetical protein